MKMTTLTRNPLDLTLAALVKSKKRGHTLWRQEWIRRARRNAVKTTWGRAVSRKILEVADYWAGKTDRELLDLVPADNPLANTPGQYYGDPISGGRYTTLFTSLETPYRWYNPATKLWWHDGAKVRNPGTGKEIVVEDNGDGFLAPAGFPRPGVRTYFTAAYRGFLIGMLLDVPYATPSNEKVIPGSSGIRYCRALPRLAQAHALTGEAQYAWKAAILLGRLAELYPYFHGSLDDDPRFVEVDHAVWQEKSTTDYRYLCSFLDAMDLVWDAVDADMERQLAEVFAAVPAPDGTKRKAPFELKSTLNAMMPYAAQLCERCRLDTWSDWSLHWIRTEAALAACTESPRLMAKILLGPSPALEGLLRNTFSRDGRHIYDSMGYLRHTAQMFLSLPMRTMGFRGGREFLKPLDLYNDARFLIDEIVAFNFKTETGALEPTFGDGSPGRNPRPPLEAALSGKPPYCPDMEVAAAFSTKCRALFQTFTQGRKRELERLRSKGDFMTLAFARALGTPVKRARSAPLKSTLLEDSPAVFLRSGRSLRTRHDLVLWGVRSGGHMHGNKLGIWLGGRGRNLAANGGAYPFSWADEARMNDWERHSAACWVVLVDGACQTPSVSDLLAFHAGDLFQFCAMANAQSHPGSYQQRKICLIPGPRDGDAYVIDIFQIRGEGRIFDYNTRGNDAGRFENIHFEFQGGAPVWEKQRGTLAGPDVALYSAPGYGWMRDVRRTRTDRDFAWQYDYGGAGLKVHALSFGRPRTLLYALGEVGGNAPGTAPWDPHVLWRDENPGGQTHMTQFVTVLESVGTTPFLQTVQSLVCTEPAIGLHPVGIKVTHRSGHTDVILMNHQPGRTVGFLDAAGARWETDASTAMQRLDPSGRVRRVEIFDGTRFKTPQADHACPGALEGVIEKVDYDRRTITVRLDGRPAARIQPRDLEDRVGILYPTVGGRSIGYRVQNATLKGAQLRFTSPLTLIHAEVPSKQATDQPVVSDERLVRKVGGRKVVVAIVPGDRFRLPLAAGY